MLNASTQEIAAHVAQVCDYADPLVGQIMRLGEVNVGEATILEHLASSIRRGYPQIRPGPPRDEVVCLVGSGPSLLQTVDELRALLADGAKLVTLNGAYRWCVDQGLRPSTQILMDARPSNARFLDPAISDCRYVLASQCAPEVWDAVAGRAHVWIFHAAYGPGPATDLLNTFYRGQWYGIGGGVTVATRAILLLSLCGWSKLHLFGIDSCWMGGAHHAIDQPENAADQLVDLTIDDPEVPGSARVFTASQWHLKQVEDVVLIVRLYGDQFCLQVHGDGLIAYVLELAAQAALRAEG